VFFLFPLNPFSGVVPVTSVVPSFSWNPQGICTLSLVLLIFLTRGTLPFFSNKEHVQKRFLARVPIVKPLWQLSFFFFRTPKVGAFGGEPPGTNVSSEQGAFRTWPGTSEEVQRDPKRRFARALLGLPPSRLSLFLRFALREQFPPGDGFFPLIAFSNRHPPLLNVLVLNPSERLRSRKTFPSEDTLLWWSNSALFWRVPSSSIGIVFFSHLQLVGPPRTTPSGCPTLLFFFVHVFGGLSPFPRENNL